MRRQDLTSFSKLIAKIAKTFRKGRGNNLQKRMGWRGEYESSSSPKIASPKGFGPSENLLNSVTTSYFGDLEVTGCLVFTGEAGFAGSLVVWVGTVGSGLRPGRQPLGRRLEHKCPLDLRSGQLP